MRNFTGGGIAAILLVGYWVGQPLLTYNRATAVNVSSEVLAQPFGDGDDLKYRWSGDVVLSCPITLHRAFIDSEDVITELTSDYRKAGDTGFLSFPISRAVPSQIALGRAEYRVWEQPHCTWLQRLLKPRFAYPPVVFEVTKRQPGI